MHIVLTVNAAWNIWNFRLPLVRAMLADGHRVTVLAPADDAASRLQQEGCAFVPLEMDTKGVNPLNDMLLFRRMRQHFAALKPDAVLSFTIKNNLYGAMAAKSLGIPFVPTVTGLGTAFLSMGASRSLVEWLYRKAFRNLPVVVFQNGDDEALFVDRRLVNPAQARRVAGSGIDLSAYPLADYPASNEETVFLFIGRVLRDKGVVEYVEAADMLHDKYPHARFQILGAAGAPNRTAIGIEEVKTWQADGHIEYLGTAPDVRPALRAVHAVVLPSYREGAPRTLIEAGALGRPAVATDVPGCRSVVDDGETGFLCEARSAQSLSRAMECFIALDGDERAAMGLAARRKIEREFAVEHVIATYRELLQQVAPAKADAA